jgi:hypothetical protein
MSYALQNATTFIIIPKGGFLFGLGGGVWLRQVTLALTAYKGVLVNTFFWFVTEIHDYCRDARSRVSTTRQNLIDKPRVISC